MANVDLVDLIPILKAIRNIKREYKQAIQTEYDDFSLYPVLTENFLDTYYNNGYVVGFKQAWKDYLGSEEVEVTLPREMRELVPATFSDSGDADYDALTSIMSFCLSIRQELKDILDLDTDLFELYPPQINVKAGEFYAAGYNDGYSAAITAINNVYISAPILQRVNNTILITTTFPGGTTYYSIGNADNWIVFDPSNPILIPEDSNITVFAYTSGGTKNSEVISDTFSYNDVLTPTISFNNNIINIYSNYYDNSTVSTMYKLSSWQNYQDFLKYDNLPIPITYDVVVWAYNYFEDGSQSDTVSLTCTYSGSEVVRPDTPDITFSSSTNYLTISCSTPGASIYYMKEGSSSWIPYTGPIKLVESGTYTAMSIKDGIESLPTSPVSCFVSSSSGTGTVFAPSIICQNNTVTVFTTQTGVTLYYRAIYGDNTYWVQYTGPFSITKTNDYQARAVLDSDNTKIAYSPIVTCEYIASNPGGGTTPGGGSGTSDDTFVAKPLIFFNNNVVSMTPVTTGSTCKYRIYGSTSWTDYSTPFTLTESCIIEAIATKDGNESALAQLNCTVDGEPTMTCYMTFDDDVLTITTNVSGGIIYYMKGNTTWEIYSGPITVNETAFYYSKVEKNGITSQTYVLYCEIDETDYYSTYFTVENICDYAIEISIRLTRDRPGAYMFDIYYNTYTTSIGTGERVWLGWKIASSGYIRLDAHDKVIFKGSPQHIDYAAKTFYIHANGRPSGHSDSKYAQYIAYGNLISLLAGDSFPTIPQNIPSGLNITLMDNCYRCNNIIYYSDWVIRKDYRSSDVPIPIINFNQITNILSFSSPLDSFLEIQYSFNNNISWITYSEPIQVDSDCIVYYKAIGQYYSSNSWSNKRSDIGSEELIINTE